MSIDPNRMIGPAATPSAQSDWLIQVARAVHLLQTGQVSPQEARPPLLMDAGADADHLLQIAQSANAVNAAAAMFRPDNAEAGRRAKIELLKCRSLEIARRWRSRANPCGGFPILDGRRQAAGNVGRRPPG